MRRILIVLVLVVGLPVSVFACLWDRDTAYNEGKGMPDVVAALTGRFPRNPPLYYRMRLDRVAAKLQSDPGDFPAYDDAGVAADRLGLGDEAIAWMEKKRAALDSHPPASSEPLYRYHANLGTFLIHRWIRQGADRGRIDEVRAAREEIAKALEINPDAHFGREKYQKSFLEWVLVPPQSTDAERLPNFLNMAPPLGSELIDPQTADETVRGLAGLIVLGNAWESVDVFYALSLALQHDTLGFEKNYGGGRNSLATYAWYRCKELVEAGKGSVLPDAPEGSELMAKLPRPTMLWADDMLDSTYHALRAEADAWQAARTDFMTTQMAKGLHPDVDPGFWNGYKEAPPPMLPLTSPNQAYKDASAWRQWKAKLVGIGMIVAVLGIAVLLAFLRPPRGRKDRAAEIL